LAENEKCQETRNASAIESDAPVAWFTGKKRELSFRCD